MTLELWWRGLLMGFAIAAPVGPIGLLCIQRTLNQGQLAGLVSGLGAATADALYGCVAGFGLTLVAAFLVDQRLWLGGIGGLFLLYMGVRTFLASPAANAAEAQQSGLLGAYVSTLFLTLTNPMTILSFVAIFAGLGLVNQDGGYLAATMLVLGVFCGSALWWLLLSGGVGLLRDKINPSALHWINRLAGVVIVAFGLVTLSHLFR